METPANRECTVELLKISLLFSKRLSRRHNHSSLWRASSYWPSSVCLCGLLQYSTVSPPTSRHFKMESWQVVDFPEVSRRKQHNAPPPRLNKTDETPAGVGTCCCNSVGDLYHFSKHLSDSPLSIAHWLRLQSTFLVSLMAKALLRLGVNNRLSVDGDLLEAQQQFHVCYLFLRELW